jgi:murein L,D-transpeptidase YafK
LLHNTRIDSLVVYKSKHQLLAYSRGKLIKTYTVALGRQPVFAKQIEGDKKIPEGIYYINDKNPNSGWHKNLDISYPNQNNIKRAKQLGKSPGGNIKIHGLQNKKGYIGKFHRWNDWTFGCIAVTNEEMDELYNAAKIGTRIEIKP